MFGWLTDVSRSIVAELERHGIAVRHTHPPGVRVPGFALTAAEIDSIESVIAIFDGDWVDSRFGGRRVSRRRLRADANEACELATATALTVGARRVLLICDARRLPPGRRAIALQWTRGLTHRISYECLVNGLPELVARYAVLDTDDVRDVADAVVTWQQGAAADNRRRWPLNPVVGGTEVTPASSAPRRTPLS